MRIMITTYGGAHVAAGLPLASHLEQCGHEVIYLALTTAGPACEAIGRPHRRPIEFADLQNPDVQRWGRQLLAHHHTSGIGLTEEESIAYLGESFREHVGCWGEEEALRQYRELGLWALVPRRWAGRILERERPDLVFATDSPRMERAMLEAAWDLDIPSVCLVCMFHHIGMDYLRKPTNGHIQCVVSERQRGQLVAAGRTPESVVVTGNPAWDASASENQSQVRSRWRREHGIAEAETVILWAEQPEPARPELPREIRNYLAQACTDRPATRLLVRLHPSSTDPRGERIPPAALVSPRSESIRTALLASDLVVTLTSTVAYEALLLDRPVICFPFSQFQSTVDYSEDMGVLVVDALPKFQAAVDCLLSDSPLAHRLTKARRALPQPGGASERIHQVMHSLVCRQVTQTDQQAGREAA